ncbi:unnamed protein product [Gongylonema pulchrum]|uniref:Ig-like domain-containing protein n=1 Tax=Gongylonema pulchrum TaxID=637853 RepID=A0A183ETC5_9BILA|nr:unnamed protein product [Gongylonema pulchrum]
MSVFENLTIKNNAHQGIVVSRVKPLSARLLFIKPTVDDGGIYKCVVKAGNGHVKDKSTRISFIQAAEFVNVETEQHPEEGKDAEIVCRVRGDPSLEIFWQFEGRNILEGLSAYVVHSRFKKGWLKGWMRVRKGRKTHTSTFV